jgi:hypothetical protein
MGNEHLAPGQGRDPETNEIADRTDEVMNDVSVADEPVNSLVEDPGALASEPESARPRRRPAARKTPVGIAHDFDPTSSGESGELM